MPKRKLGIDVLTAARERISWTFDEFENIYCSFSGGKDSTVMLHLVMEEAMKRQRKIGLLFIDFEAQYKFTIDHISNCFDTYKDHIIPYWICLPFHLRNAVSVYETHWLAWDPDKRAAWVREPPSIAITDENFLPFFYRGIEFEDFIGPFGDWYGNGEKTACFVGIRTDESLNRYRTISSTKKERLKGKQWTTLVKTTEQSKTYNIYPIYDWNTEDIWVYQGKNLEKSYNKLYDMMYKAGLTIHQQRICQPYGDDQRKGLWLFHIIEPETWGRVVARVNGANTGALYIQEKGNITGYRRVSKPPGHTWESFARLLVNSMPAKTREHYWNKITLFRKWWMDRGYPEGIPDEADYKMETYKEVPSWRRVCKSILRNDYWCKSMGFSQHKSNAYQKYLLLMRKRRKMWDIDGVYAKAQDDKLLPDLEGI